jgi:hypothetical protein
MKWDFESVLKRMASRRCRFEEAPCRDDLLDRGDECPPCEARRALASVSSASASRCQNVMCGAPLSIDGTCVRCEPLREEAEPERGDNTGVSRPSLSTDQCGHGVKLYDHCAACEGDDVPPIGIGYQSVAPAEGQGTDGGKCGNCEGRGGYTEDGIRYPCHRCNATGVVGPSAEQRLYLALEGLRAIGAMREDAPMPVAISIARGTYSKALADDVETEA